MFSRLFFGKLIKLAKCPSVYSHNVDVSQAWSCFSRRDCRLSYRTSCSCCRRSRPFFRRTICKPQASTALTVSSSRNLCAHRPRFGRTRLAAHSGWQRCDHPLRWGRAGPKSARVPPEEQLQERDQRWGTGRCRVLGHFRTSVMALQLQRWACRAHAKCICGALNKGCSPCFSESDVQWQLPPHSLCSRCSISAEAVEICVMMMIMMINGMKTKSRLLQRIYAFPSNSHASTRSVTSIT